VLTGLGAISRIRDVGQGAALHRHRVERGEPERFGALSATSSDRPPLGEFVGPIKFILTPGLPEQERTLPGRLKAVDRG
jgi:hypothetical protein